LKNPCGQHEDQDPKFVKTRAFFDSQALFRLMGDLRPYCKLLCVGDSTLNKNAMVFAHTYTDGEVFNKEYLPTYWDHSQVPREVDGQMIELGLWYTLAS
jgi:hypothetical protein